MTTPHTPGPWSFQKDYLTVYSSSTGKTQAIAKVLFSLPHNAASPCVPRDQAESNVHLIAAAPETAAERDRLKAINAELLEALEIIASQSSGIPGSTNRADCMAAIARAAIAKARGE